MILDNFDNDVLNTVRTSFENVNGRLRMASLEGCGCSRGASAYGTYNGIENIIKTIITNSVSSSSNIGRRRRRRSGNCRGNGERSKLN